ncbi:MAG: putative inorganic carbon transporter subunit DabA [Candidatus Sericytochromatia bacterium]
MKPRPELGHGTNALCFIGHRSLTKGLFLNRRAF